MLAVLFKHIWNMGSTRLAVASILLCVEIRLVIEVERIEEIATELLTWTLERLFYCPRARVLPPTFAILLIVPSPFAAKRGVPSRGLSFAFLHFKAFSGQL
jgi:hypothetical protein